MTRINRDLEYADVYSKLMPQARRYVLICANDWNLDEIVDRCLT